MTTIAVNKYSIACDLQFSHASGIKFKGATKVLEVEGKQAAEMFGHERVFIGFAGNADSWGDVVSWFAYPEGKMPKCRELEMLMLSPDGIYHGTNLKNWTRIDQPHFAIGTGMHLAIAAMDTGQTPKEAVKTACKYDMMSGMGVKEYSL